MSLLSGYCLPNGGSGATPQLFLIIWAVSPPFQNPIGTGHESPLAWMYGSNLRREEIPAFVRFILCLLCLHPPGQLPSMSCDRCPTNFNYFKRI